MKHLTIFFLLLFSTILLSAAPLPKGPGSVECPNGTEPITLFTYKPPTYKSGPLLVVCHGVGRNAEDYRNFAITLAERFGAIVVAPLFDTQRFPSARYQRGGLVGADGKAQPPEAWTYAAIPRIVAHVRALEGKSGDALPYYLVGHSAGGQFLVRLAAFMPGEAVRIIAANPGSHLFPTRDQAFGYGFGGLPDELSGDDVIRRYLAAPLTFYLGTDDIYPRPSFDDSAAGMKQGANRLERGRNCFEAALKLAAERGWAFNWRKVETPDIGHDAAFMFAAKEAGDALFGKN
ncbi:MAG: alpha/beta fold hydrolase [Opitutaceae bacterium]|nr:alpha/beta fold hydrolase [Opitutaceae bacterium]